MQLTGRTDMATEFVKGKNGIRCESYELYGEKITEIIVSEKETALLTAPAEDILPLTVRTFLMRTVRSMHCVRCLTSSFRKENVLLRGLETRL